MRAAVERARELGAVIAGDECYAGRLGWSSWDETPIPSILDREVVGDDHRRAQRLRSLRQSNPAGLPRSALLATTRLLWRSCSRCASTRA